jgi:hypothetical protein
MSSTWIDAVMLFEDDFTHEMTVQSQARGLSGVNLAILDAGSLEK